MSISLRIYFIMAFMTLIWTAKVTSGFRPIARTFVTTTRNSLGTASSSTPTVRGAGLRRKRAPASGDATWAYIEKMKREKGLYRDFQYGQFVEAADVEEELFTDAEDEDIPLAFPLKGKIPEEQPPRMRFAPSPTGSLHVGGARTALYNWLTAKKGQIEHPGSDGAFILRVEDTDVARSTKESEASVLADLEWLGLYWDEGPDMEYAPYKPYRQSERGSVYFAAAEKLLAEGKAYRCFCTPEELEQMKAEQEARGETPRYDGRWRDADPAVVQQLLDEGTPFTYRFKVPDNARVVIEDVVRGTVAWDAQATVGDFILLRSTGIPVYNFCVAVDDACMGVTTVVRAEEHLTNTVRQALILDALGAPRPRYAHCSLILGEDKQKLSKRHGATSCSQYRLDGFLPDAMINYLALLGWNDGTDNEIFTRAELIDAFELERVVKSPSVFDLGKLKWVNSQHMKRMPLKDLVALVKEQMSWHGVYSEGADLQSKFADDFAYAATSLAKQMMETTKDAAINAQKVLGYNLPATFADVTDIEAKEMIEQGNFYLIAMKIIEHYETGVFPQPDPNNLMAAFQDADGQALDTAVSCAYTQSYMAHMKVLAKELGVKGRHLFHPIRLALTGEMSGQDVTKQLSLLSMAVLPESCINREAIGIVEFGERMERLRSFCSSIPEEFRVANAAGVKADEKLSVSATDVKDSDGEGAKASAEVSASLDPKESYTGPPISALDIRVGRIVKVWDHPEADKLYCEEIDLGEGQPRQIASGLRPYLRPEDMEGRLVLVLANLKERKLVGFPSHGMVLCASNADHTVVRLVSPPVDAKLGERVTVPDFNFEGEEGEAYAENKLAKKKVFEEIAPYLVTNKYGIPEFLGRPFMTSAGVCTSPISDGRVS